jgi:hypothetical protein
MSTINTYYLLDTDLAGELGIHWIGVVNTTAEAKDIILVRAFRKYAACDATDGSGVVHYGRAVRAAVLVAERDVSVDVNFAVVAASATLRTRSAQVTIENTGFADPQVNVLAQDALPTVAASGLNVGTFSKFSEKLEAAVSAAQTSTLSPPLRKLAFVPKTDDVATLRSLATTFGLQCLSEGLRCAEAKIRFPFKGAESDAAINDTYILLTNSCDTVTQIQRLEAQSMLGSIRAQPKCH